MFAQFEKYEFHLKEIAIAFLGGMNSAESALDHFVDKDSQGVCSSDSFQGARDILKRVTRLMRFLACLFITTDTDRQRLEHLGLDELNPAEDVVWLVGFFVSNAEPKKQSALERSFSEIISKSPEWTQLCDETMRTAVSAVKLRPERNRAVDTMKKLLSDELELTTERLEEINSVASKVIEGMRRPDSKELCILVAKLLGQQTNLLLQGKVNGDKVTSRWVMALLNGLKSLKSVAGASDMANALQKWMTNNSKTTALSDLCEMANTYSATTGVADLAAVQAVLTRVQGVQIPEGRHDIVDASASLVALSLRGLVLEAFTFVEWGLMGGSGWVYLHLSTFSTK